MNCKEGANHKTEEQQQPTIVERRQNSGLCDSYRRSFSDTAAAIVQFLVVPSFVLGISSFFSTVLQHVLRMDIKGRYGTANPTPTFCDNLCKGYRAYVRRKAEYTYVNKLNKNQRDLLREIERANALDSELQA